MPRVIYRKSALKALARMPRKTALAFRDSLNRIAQGDCEGLDIRKLTGRPGMRLRIGQYRALYEIRNEDDTLVLVLVIGPRGKVYK